VLKNKGVEGLPRDHNLQVIKLVVVIMNTTIIFHHVEIFNSQKTSLLERMNQAIMHPR